VDYTPAIGGKNVDKKLKRMGLLVVALLLLGAVAVFFLREGGGWATSPGGQASPPSSDEKEALAPSAKPERPVAPEDDSLADNVRLMPRRTDEDQLVRASRPKPPDYDLPYRLTAPQSIPEVVEDLGNMRVILYCRHINSNKSPFGSLVYWSQTATPNIKVRRLIEEGRKAPDAVAALLQDSVRSCLASFDSSRKAYDQERSSDAAGQRPLPVPGSEDAYYYEHGKYENPVGEFRRLSTVAYSDFYILANIGRLGPPQLLAEWIGKERPRAYESGDFDVWLIDCYFKQAASQPASDESESIARHAALVADTKISGPFVKEPRWNVQGDPYGPSEGRSSPDETIDVLEIPYRIPLDDGVKKQIIENFREYAKEAK
jgi:hypothetical protein